MAIRTAMVTGPEHPLWMALLNSIAYCGSNNLIHLGVIEQTRFVNILEELTVEIFNSMVFEGNIERMRLRGIRGSTMMPHWDKMILSTSPREATETAFFHTTEMHMVTQQPQQRRLIGFEPNMKRFMQRLTAETVKRVWTWLCTPRGAKLWGAS